MNLEGKNSSIVINSDNENENNPNRREGGEQTDGVYFLKKKFGFKCFDFFLLIMNQIIRNWHLQGDSG